MIVSDRYGFIFLKTRKTAGTSIEIALRQFAGPDDVFTPLGRGDERICQELGYPGPRNWLKLPRDLAFGQLPERFHEVLYELRTGKRRASVPFFNPYRQHMDAQRARWKFGEQRWARYLKFTVERNPWDRTVSYYYWICRNDPDPPSFRDFVLQGRSYPEQRNYEIYSIRGIPAADVWVRYEALYAELNALSGRLGLPRPLGDAVAEIQAKSGWRPGAPYPEYYDDETRRIVELQFASEIALMGYTFEGHRRAGLAAMDTGR